MRSILISLALVSCSFAGGPSFQGFTFPNQQAYVESISANGSVVAGYSPDGAFIWSPSAGYNLLPKPTSLPSQHATGISSDGTYIAGYSVAGIVRWNTLNNSSQSLPTPSSYLGATAWGISGDGSTVIGRAEFRQGDGSDQAVSWDANGSVQPLGFLPASGTPLTSGALAISGDGHVIVGYSGGGWAPNDKSRAFRWSSQTGMIDMGRLKPTDTAATATVVSHDGSVIAGISQADRALSPPTGWVWTDQTGMQPLGDLPGGREWTEPLGVSADGRVIVGRSESSAGMEAFILDETHGIRSLKSVLVDDYSLNLDGWTLSSAVGISGDGMTIIGLGYDPAGNARSWIVTVPEPSALLLLLGASVFQARKPRQGMGNRRI